MSLFKRLSRSAFVQETAGLLVSLYLRLVKATTRFVRVGDEAGVRAHRHVIVAMWHGQHFAVSFFMNKGDTATALVSRSKDGEFNALALHHLGVKTIRGSGARGRNFHDKGGVLAMRGLLRALQQDMFTVLTADVPKIARVCGEGIVVLAQKSGCPIVPVAVVTRWQIGFNSWDKASFSLPFGRGAMVVGKIIPVAKNANDDELEAARLMVQNELDLVHEQAYGLVGIPDPGRHLNRPLHG